MTVAIFVQARMGATRLPGKPLLKVLGRTLLSYLIERLSWSKLADKTVILTTTHPRDNLIAAEAEKNKALLFRGSEDDVLSRYYDAAQQYKPSTIVRITADCPLMDPEVIDAVVHLYQSQQPHCDYASNTLQRTYPRGMDVEVFSFDALSEAYHNAKENFEREHVTPYIYRHPEKYNILQQQTTPDHSHWRWTVDTKEDFILISKLIATLYPQKPSFNLDDLTKCFLEHPDWAHINAHIEQKSLPADSNAR